MIVQVKNYYANRYTPGVFFPDMVSMVGDADHVSVEVMMMDTIATTYAEEYEFSAYAVGVLPFEYDLGTSTLDFVLFNSVGITYAVEPSFLNLVENNDQSYSSTLVSTFVDVAVPEMMTAPALLSSVYAKIIEDGKSQYGLDVEGLPAPASPSKLNADVQINCTAVRLVATSLYSESAVYSVDSTLIQSHKMPKLAFNPAAHSATYNVGLAEKDLYEDTRLGDKDSFLQAVMSEPVSMYVEETGRLIPEMEANSPIVINTSSFNI